MSLTLFFGIICSIDRKMKYLRNGASNVLVRTIVCWNICSFLTKIAGVVQKGAILDSIVYCVWINGIIHFIISFNNILHVICIKIIFLSITTDILTLWDLCRFVTNESVVMVHYKPQQCAWCTCCNKAFSMASGKLGHSVYDLWFLAWDTLCRSGSLPANIVLYIVL